jgi:DNA-nicking Smr family endonuclease
MFSRRKPRALSPEDLKLWQEVVKGAAPLRPTAPLVSDKTALPVAPVTPKVSLTLERSPPSGKGSVKLDLAPTLAERLSPDPLKMDQRRFTQMRRGKLVPENRIDLHGLTLDQAHAELVPFIMASWSGGMRLVLVITGKGKPRDEQAHGAPRAGLLRHHVPHWLTMPPLRAVVLQLTEAHQRHGGAGALYVYLRRQDRGPFTF